MLMTYSTPDNTINNNTTNLNQSKLNKTMATQRRTNLPEKTVLSHAEIKAEPKSNIAPAVPSFVHLKAIECNLSERC
jgi:hypothetical protein